MSDDQVSRLSGEIERLYARISELERLLREHMEGALPEAPRVTPAPAPPPVPEAQPPPPVRPVPSPQPVAAEARKSDLEVEFGGNWLNKIGAVALVLAMAFFLKYAIDNRWVNETGRVIIGIVVGLACVYGGEYFQKRNLPRYAQGISGAGIAILYFSIYAAFAFYHLIPQSAAFGFMVVVTATAIALSVRHDAVAIAILGIVGAFLTPVLLRGADGDGQGVRLFTYIAILDLGILGITYYKGWRELNLLSLAGTVLIFAGWFVESYSPEKLGITMAFLTVFLAIFAAQSFVQNVVARRPMNSADICIALAAPALYFSTAFALLSPKYRVYLGAFSAVMAALYLLLAQNVRVIRFEDKRVRILFLSVSTIFLTIAIPIQLSGYWVTIGWAFEAAILFAIGFYLSSVRTRYAATVLFGLVVLRLITVDTFAGRLIPFYNLRFLAFLAAVAMGVLVTWLYRQYREATPPRERWVPALLILVANFVMIWGLSVEAVSSFTAGPYPLPVEASKISVALSAVWLAYAVLILAGGIIWRYRPVRIMALALIGVVILKSFVVDVWTLEKLYRIIAFVALGLVLLVSSYVYQAYRDKIRI